MQPRSRRTLVLNERRPFRDSLRVLAVAGGSLVAAVTIAFAVPDDAHAVVPVSLFMLTIVGAAVLGGPIAAFVAAAGVSVAMAFAFLEPLDGFGIDAPDAVLASGLFLATALALSFGLARLEGAKQRANAEKLELDLLAEAARALSTLDLELAIRRLALVLVPGSPTTAWSICSRTRARSAG